MKLSELIKKEMKVLGRKQTDIAEMGYLSRTTINRIFNDTYFYKIVGGKKVRRVNSIPQHVIKGLENSFGKELVTLGEDDFEWGKRKIYHIYHDEKGNQVKIPGHRFGPDEFVEDIAPHLPSRAKHGDDSYSGYRLVDNKLTNLPEINKPINYQDFKNTRLWKLLKITLEEEKLLLGITNLDRIVTLDAFIDFLFDIRKLPKTK